MPVSSRHNSGTDCIDIESLLEMSSKMRISKDKSILDSKKFERLVDGEELYIDTKTGDLYYITTDMAICSKNNSSQAQQLEDCIESFWTNIEDLDLATWTATYEPAETVEPKQKLPGGCTRHKTTVNQWLSQAGKTQQRQSYRNQNAQRRNYQGRRR